MAAPAQRTVSFDLDRFVTEDDRLVIVGRWFGVRGRRFMRPSLSGAGDDHAPRALAVLDHKPWAAEDGEDWIAAFSWDGPLPDSFELAVAPDLAVELPAPGVDRSSKRRPRSRHPAKPRPRRVASEGLEQRGHSDGAAPPRPRRERRESLPAREAVPARRAVPARESAPAGESAPAREAVPIREAREALAAREAAIDTARAERDAARRERDEAVRERDAVLAARDRAVGGLRRAADTRTALEAERDALAARCAELERITSSPLVAPALAPVTRAARLAQWSQQAWGARYATVAAFGIVLLVLVIIFTSR